MKAELLDAMEAKKLSFTTRREYASLSSLDVCQSHPLWLADDTYDFKHMFLSHKYDHLWAEDLEACGSSVIYLPGQLKGEVGSGVGAISMCVTSYVRSFSSLTTDIL